MSAAVQIEGNRVRITRVFDAPRALVFTFWSQAEKLQQWTGCKEATHCEVEMDFRVGGSFRQKMQIEGAGEFTITGTYDEIVEPELIAYHADLAGAITHVRVEFIEQGERTTVILTQAGLPDEMICKIVSQGTVESFAKLDQRLLAQPV